MGFRRATPAVATGPSAATVLGPNAFAMTVAAVTASIGEIGTVVGPLALDGLASAVTLCAWTHRHRGFSLGQPRGRAIDGVPVP